MRHAQIRNGRVVAVLEAEAEAVPGLVPVPEAANVIAGETDYDGSGFVPAVKAPAELAADRLRQIDAETGMSRTLREALIAIAGPGKLVFLEAKEAEAATERGKLGAQP